MTDTVIAEQVLAPMRRLKKDLALSSVTLTEDEARYVVSYYYQIQEWRKAAGSRIFQQDKEKAPHLVLSWFFNNLEQMETDIKKALDVYSNSKEIGRWSKSITGIGPVIAAGLIAYIDMRPSEKYPTSFSTVAKVWRFAGLDSTISWLGRDKARELLATYYPDSTLTELEVREIAVRTNRNQDSFLRMCEVTDGKAKREKVLIALARRPWNAGLKVLCWKIGESFVKVSTNEADYYGKYYLKRKAEETIKNERGDYAELAQQILAAKRFGRETEAYKAYIQGRLPAGHIHARAKRYAVKLFLSHWHAVNYEIVHGKPAPTPWVIEFGGHKDYIKPPNWPMA